MDIKKNCKFRSYFYHRTDQIKKLNDVTFDDHGGGYHELTICLQGKMSYTVKGQRFDLNTGDIIYLPPKTKRLRAASKQPATYVSINFYSVDDEPLLPTFHFKKYVNKTIVSVLEILDQTVPWKKHEKFLTLVELILLEIKDQYTSLTQNPHVAKIKDYIFHHLNEKITIDEIAANVFLSKIYCENLFKKHTGKTIMNYINEQKINNACSLLLQSDIPLKHISETLGFYDYNYFSRIFKAQTGVSPQKYRLLTH